MSSKDTQFKKGHKLSPESLLKMANSLKGRPSWNKGTKGVMKAWNKGKKTGHTPWNKGKVLSDEIKKKLSVAHLGQKSPMKGKTHSKETRAKIALAGIGRKNTSKGKTRSEQVRIKMRKPHLSNRGEKNHNWKGGITSINHKLRTSPDMVAWRKACFERDNYMCQKTKISGGRLVVHHINNFADFPELRFAIDNGITLSDLAHRTFHKIYGNRNNTRQQLEEFINDTP